jgi:hypothetical protein
VSAHARRLRHLRRRRPQRPDIRPSGHPETLKAETITVGTADSLQGGQWHAVVALDPFVGYTTATTHQLSPGRLCVMACRHMTHLTWVSDGGWELALMDPDIDPDEAEKGRKVRQVLTAK